MGLILQLDLKACGIILDILLLILACCLCVKLERLGYVRDDIIENTLDMYSYRKISCNLHTMLIEAVIENELKYGTHCICSVQVSKAQTGWSHV